jgi:hypothetical protein
VSPERARELLLQHIDQDPSLESLRELYEQDLAKPELDIITVTGLKCVGVPIGTPEFVNALVRSKAHAIEQDVQKLRIIQEPKIHNEWVAGQNLADPNTCLEQLCPSNPQTASR